MARDGSSFTSLALRCHRLGNGVRKGQSFDSFLCAFAKSIVSAGKNDSLRIEEAGSRIRLRVDLFACGSKLPVQKLMHDARGL